MTQTASSSYVGIPGRNEYFGTFNSNTNYTINGDDGSDVIIAYNANDALTGGLGVDLVIGDFGDDVIFGDRFWNDYATSPNQNLAAGADLIIGDRFSGDNSGAGRDTIFAGGGNNFVNAGGAADYVVGGNGRELLQGGEGADLIFGYDGSDKLYGGTASASAQASFVTSNIGTDITTNFNGFDDTASSNQTSLLSNLGGVALVNTGADSLDGGEGNDSIDGGDGGDLLTGGLGYDRFIFACSNTLANADHITDFKHAVDKIVLDHTYYSKLAVGALSSSAYKDIASGSVDSNDRILYNHNTGQLFYDADGSGSASAHQFATLDNKPAVLSASDFTIVA